ncbi:MAG: hypothetical protein OT477_01535 [Chloroflexi bacterium]|nr:hypothetical protein [Chloroflexota bacterium]
MKPDTLQCSYCGHIWQDDLPQRAREKQAGYRGDNDKPMILVRIECPVCGKYTVFKVEASRVNP